MTGENEIEIEATCVGPFTSLFGGEVLAWFHGELIARGCGECKYKARAALFEELEDLKRALEELLDEEDER